MIDTDEVLWAFAVEPHRNLKTLARYAAKFPAKAIRLAALYVELGSEDAQAKHEAQLFDDIMRLQRKWKDRETVNARERKILDVVRAEYIKRFAEEGAWPNDIHLLFMEPGGAIQRVTWTKPFMTMAALQSRVLVHVMQETNAVVTAAVHMGRNPDTGLPCHLCTVFLHPEQKAQFAAVEDGSLGAWSGVHEHEGVFGTVMRPGVA